MESVMSRNQDKTKSYYFQVMMQDFSLLVGIPLRFMHKVALTTGPSELYRFNYSFISPITLNGVRKKNQFFILKEG